MDKSRSNTHCDSIQHLMVDALFGDIESAGESQLRSHLEACSSCSKIFAEMEGTLSMTKQVPDEMPSEFYWAGFQQRLNDRIEAGQQRKSVLDLNAWSSKVRRLFVPMERPRFVWAYQLGIALVLVMTGVLIGRYGFSDSSRSAGIAHRGGVDSTAIKAMQVVSQTESYLNRSGILLLGLANYDAESDGNTILNFEHKQKVANTLMQEATVLKASLNPSEEAQLLMLIEDLEKILLQIANLEMQEDMPGIEMIQDGIEGRALLLKINLETMKLMDQPASMPTEEITL